MTLNEVFAACRSTDGFEHEYLKYPRWLGLPNYKVLTMAEFVEHKMSFGRADAFIVSEGEVLAVANEIAGNVVCIILRSMHSKDFVTLGSTQIPYNLGGFPKSSRFVDPIVIVEGVKDCDVIRAVYPNVIALLTSTISASQAKILSSFAHRFFLLSDDDDAGREGAVNTRKLLRGEKCESVVLKQFPGFKDPGDIVKRGIDRDTQLSALRFYRTQFQAHGLRTR